MAKQTSGQSLTVEQRDKLKKQETIITAIAIGVILSLLLGMILSITDKYNIRITEVFNVLSRDPNIFHHLS